MSNESTKSRLRLESMPTTDELDFNLKRGDFADAASWMFYRAAHTVNRATKLRLFAEDTYSEAVDRFAKAKEKHDERMKRADRLAEKAGELNSAAEDKRHKAESKRNEMIEKLKASLAELGIDPSELS